MESMEFIHQWLELCYFHFNANTELKYLIFKRTSIKKVEQPFLNIYLNFEPANLPSNNLP